MSKLMKTRFVWLFIIPNLVFAAIAYLTEAAQLIVVLNFALVALWVGVCVAYYPPVVVILLDDRPLDRADILALGIFCGGFSIVVIRTWSMVWRILGKPEWLLESDIVSYALFTSVIAAVFHLAAPGGLNDRVPPKRWINIGISIAALVFAGLVLAFVLQGKVPV
jgi:hypothetical protein